MHDFVEELHGRVRVRAYSRPEVAFAPALKETLRVGDVPYSRDAGFTSDAFVNDFSYWLG
jgi:hypothetical protein